MRNENTRLLLISEGATAGFERCALLNLSPHGMCVRTRSKLELGQQYTFLLDLPQRMFQPVEARVRPRWSKPVESGIQDVGVEFVDATFGWLCPTS